MRLIEEAAWVLGRLLGLREDGRYQEAFDLIDGTLASFFPFKRELLHHTLPEDLPEILTQEYGMNDDQMTILADFLREEGNLWYRQGEWSKATASMVRALAILEFLDHKQADLYSFDRVQKLDLIRNMLGNMDEDS